MSLRGQACVVFLALFLRLLSASSPQITITLGIEFVKGDCSSLGSSSDLFLSVCADKREHVVVSQGARLELPGSLESTVTTISGGSGGLSSVVNRWSIKDLKPSRLRAPLFVSSTMMFE